MKEKPIELIGYDLPVMRLLVEGAIALFEDEWDDNPKETADMMGHALYSLRVQLRECQNAYSELSLCPVKEE